MTQDGSVGGTVSCHVPHDLVLFLFSAAAAVTVTAPRRHCRLPACSVLFVGGSVGHLMPCHAMPALRALSHIDKGRVGGASHLAFLAR